MTRAYLKISVGREHDITKVKALIRKHEPRVVVLESESPRLNNRVIPISSLGTYSLPPLILPRI